MKITKLEEVTRTYCDICNTDITREAQYGYYNVNGNPVNICSGRPRPVGTQSCEERFLARRAYLSGDRDFN